MVFEECSNPGSVLWIPLVWMVREEGSGFHEITWKWCTISDSVRSNRITLPPSVGTER